jgi:hypothetical protein
MGFQIKVMVLDNVLKAKRNTQFYFFSGKQA